MADDQPTLEQLKRRQRDQELAEREALAEAETDAEADKHRRRADKARYLREKLAQRELADQQAAREDD
ncbi:MAG: hypothetical protein ACR2MK_02120 [Solirubrobacteraceae bacterium]